MDTFFPKGNMHGLILPFFIIRRKISLDAKVLYAVLCSYAGRNDHCYVYYQVLAENLSCSVNSVKKYLTELSADKLILIEKIPYKACKFTLLMPEDNDSNDKRRYLSNNDVMIDTLELQSEFDIHSSNFDYSHANYDKSPSNFGYDRIKKNINTIPPLPPEKSEGGGTVSTHAPKPMAKTPSTSCLANNAFETLWNIYPRKQDKESARTVWHRLWRRGVLPAVEELIALINRLRSSANWLKEHGRFVPMLTNWLKGHRWLDESPEDSTALPRPNEIEDHAQKKCTEHTLAVLEERQKAKAAIFDSLRPAFNEFFSRFHDQSCRGPAWGLWCHMHCKGIAPSAADVPSDNTLPPLQFLQHHQREAIMAA